MRLKIFLTQRLTRYSKKKIRNLENHRFFKDTISRMGLLYIPENSTYNETVILRGPVFFFF